MCVSAAEVMVLWEHVMGKAGVVLEPLLEVQENSLEHRESDGKKCSSSIPEAFYCYLPVV